MTACIHMPHLPHKCIEILRISVARDELLKPIPKNCIECRALCAGNGVRLLN